MVRLGLMLAAAGLCVAAVAAAGETMQFRGESGNGVLPAQAVRTDWENAAGVAWKVPNPAAGWAQPVLHGAHVYIAGAVGEGQLKPSNFADGVKSPQSMGVSLFAKPPKAPLTWKLFCLSEQDGGVLWEREIVQKQASYPIHPSNSWQTETPAADDTGVYVFCGAAGVLSAYGHDGALKWQQQTEVCRTSNGFGTGSSPALADGRVIMQLYGEDSAVVRCFDSITGKPLWTFERPDKGTSWSSPLVWRNRVRTEVVCSGGDRLDALDPVTGAVLWTVRRVKAATACSPCCDSERLYFGGSDPFSKGPLFAVKAGASGDVTPEKANQKFAQCDWLSERQGPGMASPVSSGKYVYTNDNNILKCFDAATGERLYQTRIPGLDMLAASPLLIGDRLLLLDENGKGCLVNAGPEFQVVGRGSLPDTFWATPAVKGGAMYFRGVDWIYCVRK